jgi:hypothetical protein
VNSLFPTKVGVNSSANVLDVNIGNVENIF